MEDMKVAFLVNVIKFLYSHSREARWQGKGGKGKDTREGRQGKEGKGGKGGSGGVWENTSK